MKGQSKPVKTSIGVIVALSLSACAGSLAQRSEGGDVSTPMRTAVLNIAQAPSDHVEYPSSWERLDDDVVTKAASSEHWWHGFNDPQLNQLVSQAVSNNFSLKAQGAVTEELRQGVLVSRANRLPSLSASLFGSRRKDQSFNSTSAARSSFGLGLDGQYEVDVWQQLSDAQRNAQLLYRAQQFDYEASRLTLEANVTRAWYTAIYARQLLDLFAQRVDNINKNLEIIERGYQQGLYSALDVYLARTSAEQEKARLAQQEQVVLEQSASLQLLLAQYPSGATSFGDVELSSTLPQANQTVPTGLPSEILTRRPDIQAAWSALLARDAAVAVAHKNRFPRLVLSASLDDGASSLSDIVDGDDLFWSALANISQPIFQAGRLQALEEQARQRLIQSEQAYLTQIQNAFAEVENALSEYNSLQKRFAAISRSEENASAAYDLSFQQYQRGLVDYTTVLQAEQRAFDANFNLIDLTYRLLINRINLYAALGGEEAS